MTENVIEKYGNNIFENHKKKNEFGNEYWSARDFYSILEYQRWDSFVNVLKKAQKACENSDQDVLEHFYRVEYFVNIGSGADRDIGDLQLSRYACYLVVQNADPSKTVVALGQTYFAVQTRKQELQDSEEYNNLGTEDDKRLYLRQEMKKHNKDLASAANDAGVKKGFDYAIFQDHGYKGLYGGLGAKDIKRVKELKKSQQILDHMGSTELAANLFRATQTEEKLRRDKIKGKTQANKTHFEVGRKVRQTIAEIGGTMPEDLPVADSIKKLERKKKKKIKDQSENDK